MLRHKGSQKTKLCRDKGFLCHDIPYSIATLIKANDRGTMSRYFTTLSQHKELNMAEKFVVTKDNYVATQNLESTLKGKKTLLRHRSFMS